jgi:aminoglycoside/choline kinase family phosphotransferase
MGGPGITDVLMDDSIATYLKRAGMNLERVKVVPLTGDASDRQYFRVFQEDGDSLVLALHAYPFAIESLPFVNVAELFGYMPVPVPEILGHAGDLRVLALQDLGDVTLQAHLGSAPEAEHDALYRQAIDLLVVIQRRGRELTSPKYVAYSNRFDVEKLTWELDFFLKHFLEGYRGAVLEPQEYEDLQREFRPIGTELAAETPELCHRDYHSRNLMLHHGQLYIIDFQDARLGPATYDLVSLLRDSYVDLSEDAVECLIEYFLRHSGNNVKDFRRRFDLMALQRNLKALGTFGYQTVVRQNPVYIQYMPRTLRHVRDNLAKYPRFARLRAGLAAHLEELE